MAKKVKAIVKLQIQACKATPAPPVGPALGQHGVNIMGLHHARIITTAPSRLKVPSCRWK